MATYNGCVRTVYTGCIIYNGPALQCVTLNSYTPSVTDVFMAFHAKICTQQASFTLPNTCFTDSTVKSYPQFIQRLINVLCQLVGGDPTATIDTETLYNYFISLNQPTILTCYRQLTGISANADLLTLLRNLQEQICNLSTIRDIFVRVSETDKYSGYLEDKLVCGDCISLIEVQGSNGLALQASVDFNCLLNLIGCDLVTACTT